MNARYDEKSKCCICLDGYQVINGKCSNYQYCGLNAILRYGQCECNDGFFFILGYCQPCGNNEAYNGVVCECLIGFVRDVNGKCVRSNFIPNCFQNERYDNTLRACVCVAGTQFLNGKCTQIPTCPANAYFSGASCVCKTGFFLESDTCRDVTTIELPPACPANAFFNGVSCTCNVGFYQSAISACAPCPAGTQWNGFECAAGRTCGAGFGFNEASSACEPLAPSCGANARWNGATCICVDGTHLIENRCQSCAQGKQFDGTRCADVTVTPAPAPCGSNQVRIGGQCVCTEGFYLINGQCTQCPDHTKWNGVFCECHDSDVNQWCYGRPFTVFSQSCACQTGYTLVNGLCSK